MPKKLDHITEYNEKERAFWMADLPTSMTLNPPQFLKFALSQQFIGEGEFGMKVARDRYFMDYLLANKTLPQPLKVQLNTLSRNLPTLKGFWDQSRYTVTLNRAGALSINGHTMPELMLNRTIPPLSHETLYALKNPAPKHRPAKTSAIPTPAPTPECAPVPESTLVPTPAPAAPAPNQERLDSIPPYGPNLSNVARAYKEKVCALCFLEGPQRATFTPWEYVSFLLYRHKIKVTTFKQLLNYKERLLNTAHDQPGFQLPADIAVALSQLAATSPYTDPLYWRQPEFTVIQENGTIRTDSGADLPTLDLTHPLHPITYHKGDRDSDATTYEKKALAFKYGKEPSAEATFSPWEFVRFTLCEQHIPEEALGLLLGRGEHYAHNAAHHPGHKLPKIIVTLLSQMATEAPYTDPLYWRQTQFTLKREGETLTTAHGCPLPTLHADIRYTPRPYHTSQRGSSFDQLEDTSIALRYGAPEKPLTLTPAGLFFYLLRAQQMPLEEAQQRLAPQNDKFLFLAMRNGFSRTMQRTIASMCDSAPYNDPEYWNQREVQVTPQTELPTLDWARATQQKESATSHQARLANRAPGKRSL